MAMDADIRDINEGVLSELECPVCLEYMLPPIELCKNGHNICSNCRVNLQECPTCTQPFVNIRNLALENLTKRVKYPCTNRKFGCKETHPVDLIKGHEDVCRYAAYTCPFVKEKQCPWADVRSNLKQHLLECHGEDVTTQFGETSLIINTDSVELQGCKVVFAHNEIFYVHILRRVDNYYIVVMYVGTPENASKYGYSICFKKKDDTESITVCHVARSFAEDLDQIYQSGDCFSLPLDVLKRFVTHGADVPYKLKILKK
jgi:E3 ubiquitin-protein ligase SIAH1